MPSWFSEYDTPDNWDPIETILFQGAVGESYLIAGDSDIGSDPHLQFLYHEAFFDMSLKPYDREVIQLALFDYVWEEYGIDFEIVFDWEGYREWYDAV